MDFAILIFNHPMTSVTIAFAVIGFVTATMTTYVEKAYPKCQTTTGNAHLLLNVVALLLAVVVLIALKAIQ
jgi:hypothetical protein